MLEKFILNYEHNLLKEIFVFDYYKNEKINEIKIGFRFIFQSADSTITETQVNAIMDAIIKETIKFKGVTIPGL